MSPTDGERLDGTVAGEVAPLTRASLPPELTPETIRTLSMAVLRRLAQPGNGILGPEEQASFDAALHEVMRGTAHRVSQQINRADWARLGREAERNRRRSGGGRPSRVDERLRRLATSIDQQIDLAEALAPGVDWSFAQPVWTPPPLPGTETTTPPGSSEPREPTEPVEPAGSGDQDTGTVSDLEDRLSDQVELVQVMSEIAEVSKRTYALEQQRDLQNTRGVFFGFVVSVAVLVAGWAPVVAAESWAERFWILGLTVVTCVLAGLVYALVRRWQNAHPSDADD